MSGPASYAVVVLAGGRSRRMGGGDKTALDLGAGRSVLSHLVSGLDTSVSVVVVGPAHPLERSVRWARESPPGGGPVAGLVAGLDALPSDGAEWVVAIAGDQPYAAPAVPLLLAAASAGVDVVLGVDGQGRDQPLLAAYRRSALTRVCAALGGSPAGRSMHALLELVSTTDGDRVRRVALPDPATLDVDDPGGLSAARAALGRSPAGPEGRPPRTPPQR